MKCRTEENVDTVNDVILSQEDMPQTHRILCEISRDTSIRLRWNYHSEFGSWLLLERSIISKKCNKFEHLSFSG